jgi:hypothetical protein
MDTAKYIIKKTKLMHLTKKQLTEKKQYEKSVNKLNKSSASAHLDDTYFLLAQMYSQENDPLFI